MSDQGPLYFCSNRACKYISWTERFAQNPSAFNCYCIFVFINRLFPIQHTDAADYRIKCCTDTRNSKESHSTKTQVEGSPTDICLLKGSARIPLPMSCLLTDQGISPALLNRSPSTELPGDNLWPDITAAFTSVEILTPKHHYAASHTSTICSCSTYTLHISLHLRTELPKFFLLLPDLALLQRFILPLLPLLPVLAGTKGFPSHSYFKKGEKKSCRTQMPPLSKQRRSFHQLAEWL